MLKLEENIVFSNIQVRLIESKKELIEAQKLRYEMLILDYSEKKDGGCEIDEDEYDEFCDHLIAIDTKVNKIIGTYRLIRGEHLSKLKTFLTEKEFNIDKIKEKGFPILELGRAVVHPDYRNGIVIKLLWMGIFSYCKQFSVRFLVGTACYHGNDVDVYQHSFSYLYYNHLSDNDLMAYASKESRHDLNILKEEEVNDKIAKKQTPALIRNYLKLGCSVGEGVFIDKEFNSIDILILLDLINLNEKYADKVFKL